LHLPHLHIPGHRRSTKETPNVRTSVSGISEVNQSSKQLTEQEIEQRRLIEQYIFSKLEAYANKPRIWQLTHSSHIKRRLLDKSGHISNLYSVPNDFVRESINQLFVNVDKHILQLRRLVQSTSSESVDPDVLFQKARRSKNQWRSLQLERAKQIFPDIVIDEYTENEILQKYYTHIIETLTPKADTASTNCIAQLREEPFDLNHEYEQAERKGKDYLSHLLQNYHERSTPDLQIIQEMVNLGKRNQQYHISRNFEMRLHLPQEVWM
jgi:hypothetical protein